MSIHLYTDPELIHSISEGDMSSPDADTFDGGDGESRDRELFIANTQALLTTAISATDTSLNISTPVFGDGDYIIIESEIVRVTGGGGTLNLTVERGVNGTASSSHAAGVKVYYACNYDAVTIQAVDMQGEDESSWVSLASVQEGLETAVPGEVLVLGAKRYDVTLPFWRRITVPSGAPTQDKSDIKLRLTAVENPIAM